MKKILGYIIAILGLQIILTFLKKAPYSVEYYYSSHFYLFINNLLTNFNKRFQFSIGDWLYVFIAFLLILELFKIIRNRKEENIIKNISELLLKNIFNFLLLFQIFWGLNNLRIPVANKLQITTSYESNDLYALTNKLLIKTNALQRKINENDSIKVDFNRDINDFNKAARIGYKNLEDQFKIAKIQHSDVKKSLFSKYLTKAGFSGYLNPFTHEAQINYEIPVVGMPVTVAHEIAHQKGIATESEANFFGYLAMINQNNIDYQFAGNLYALKYCLKEIRANDEEKFLLYFNQLNFGIQKNILESEAFWLANKNFSSDILKNVYGNFLKMNNQKEGMKSYNRFVDLLINYDKKYPL